MILKTVVLMESRFWSEGQTTSVGRECLKKNIRDCLEMLSEVIKQ